MNDGLNTSLLALRRRVRLLMVERYGLIGASAGALVAAVMVLLSQRYDALLSYGLWIGTILLGAVAGGIYGLLRKLGDLAVAMAADKRTGLKERLSTAVALQGSSDEMVRALMSDAKEHISGFRPREVFRHRFGMPHYVFGAALLVLLAIIVLPRLPAFQSKTRRQEVAVMKREGKKLVRVAKDLKKLAAPREENIRKLANRLQALGKKMETGRMTRKQAMLRTQRLNKEIQKEQDRLAKLNSPKSMEQAQAQMKKASMELAKRMADEIAKKENIPPGEALAKVPTDQRLKELARKEGPLTESERRELEQAIQKYTDPNSNLPIPAELAEAMSKLAQSGDFQKAMALMQQVAKKLGMKGGGKMSKMDQKMLQEQMKQLAEALKNTDLDKLAKQLAEDAQKLANMSPEELKKLMKQMQMAQKMAKAAGT